MKQLPLKLAPKRSTGGSLDRVDGKAEDYKSLRKVQHLELTRRLLV
jgi:hypothetical protein